MQFTKKAQFLIDFWPIQSKITLSITINCVNISNLIINKLPDESNERTGTGTGSAASKVSQNGHCPRKRKKILAVIAYRCLKTLGIALLLPIQCQQIATYVSGKSRILGFRLICFYDGLRIEFFSRSFLYRLLSGESVECGGLMCADFCLC